ncbi:MAG: hypothetical protein GJU73_09270 [Ferrovum sp.]|jgi:hypothetical protein|uniref:hypothetical protein n=1 Tax=Ferrovum sp. TaxID=2609467 RepID=UPI00262436C7|nr:hypothetical protein [Ferrovum sp.]MBW8067621.1 hypothetical protein [Ferrovum sp.]
MTTSHEPDPSSDDQIGKVIALLGMGAGRSEILDELHLPRFQLDRLRKKALAVGREFVLPDGRKSGSSDSTTKPMVEIERADRTIPRTPDPTTNARMGFGKLAGHGCGGAGGHRHGSVSDPFQFCHGDDIMIMSL